MSHSLPAILPVELMELTMLLRDVSVMPDILEPSVTKNWNNHAKLMKMLAKMKELAMIKKVVYVKLALLVKSVNYQLLIVGGKKIIA